MFRADPCATADQVEALRQFLASGCELIQSRITIEGGLLLRKADAARFLGFSRDHFDKLADEVMPNGKPRFTRACFAGETYPRYFKIELMEFEQSQRDASLNERVRVAS